MSEEFGHWLEAAKPALPWALGALVLVLASAAVTWVLVRQRWAAARQAEKRAEHLWHNIDCVVEPTQAIDMRPLVAHADKARFNALTVITDVRERIKAVWEPQPDDPDWTPQELAEVKAMTDRDGWPNTTYQPRGFLPRLRRRPVPVVAVTPKEIGERIKKIRDEKKAVA